MQRALQICDRKSNKTRYALSFFIRLNMRNFRPFWAIVRHFKLVRGKCYTHIVIKTGLVVAFLKCRRKYVRKFSAKPPILFTQLPSPLPAHSHSETRWAHGPSIDPSRPPAANASRWTSCELAGIAPAQSNFCRPGSLRGKNRPFHVIDWAISEASASARVSVCLCAR